MFVRKDHQICYLVLCIDYEIDLVLCVGPKKEKYANEEYRY